MAYGLRIKDNIGNVLLNTPDIVSRMRYSIVAASGVSNYTTLSDITGKTTYAFSIKLTPGITMPHAVSISGTTFSWTAQSDTVFASSDSLVGVIIVD